MEVLSGHKELREHKELRQYSQVTMVFLVHKEHKGFREHKVRFKDIREPVVMEVQQVTSVLLGLHREHPDLQVLKGHKEHREHKVE
jgi:hypothetical protein